jgi:NAD(P)-dependent dehydrogenase (short-subunit alcohol dehydrogenase family)
VTDRPVILITGATEGIGKAAAFELARRGARVLATGRKPEKLEKLVGDARQRGLELETLVLDVTRADSIEVARAEAFRLTGGHGVDVLVNNAGYGETGTVAGLTPERLRTQFETNVIGLQAVTRAFLPAMFARKYGRVINISSIGGRVTMPLFGAYHASKYAIEALSDALRMEARGQGVRVVLIEPGLINTRFTDTAMTGLGRVEGDEPHHGPAIRRLRELERSVSLPAGKPETVARVIARAALSRCPRARYMVPRSAYAMYWFSRATPTALRDLFFGVILRLLARSAKRHPAA